MSETQLPDIDAETFRSLDNLLQRCLEADPAQTPPQELAQLLTAHDPLQALLADGGSDELHERLSILRRAYPALKRYKDSLNIGTSLLAECFAIYIPIARFMAKRARQVRATEHRAVVFGINGGQGSGKTTINAFLQIILGQGLGLKAAGFSIDDVYKTYEQRQAMAHEVHPLFAIRSVAGTHDTALAMDTLNALTHADADTRIAIPHFDKMARGGQGDRLAESQWPVVEGPLDVVIFEGWFVGARAQSEEQLAKPINQREADEDPDSTWRNTMNRLLATDYGELFDLIDELLVIQVRSMEDVFRNRELQEQHLRRKLEEAHRRGEDTGDQGAMSADEVVAFISLYERTTRHMLATLPQEARLTLFIGDHHRIERVRIN